MASIYTILEGLKTYLLASMDPSPQPALTADQIAIIYPEQERIRQNATIFLFPEGGDGSIDTTETGLDTYGITAHITVQQSATTPTDAALTEAALVYLDALVDAINSNPTLGGAVVEIRLTDWDNYYNPPVVGIEAHIQILKTVP
jgi:hypothetical protein